MIEQLIGNRLREADVRDPDIDTQYLTAERALQELTQIRQVTFTAGGHTVAAVQRRSALRTQILTALGVDTRAWIRPTITT